ncbi:MAG: DUF4249 domain-containing protein [Flavobacteriales bacterium]|nr:DUF4249 domain-containing protein [Flavobacteriales bacterium]
MRNRPYILFLLSTMILVSCQKKIDFELNDQENSRLVVEGSITDQAKAHTIELTRTTSYYENQPAPREEGATVTITDGITTHTLTETSPGVYQTSASYAGVIGRTYTLNITTADNQFYTAESTLESVAPIDTVLLDVGLNFEDEDVLILSHYGPEPAGVGNNYMWLVNINGIDYTEDVNDIMFVTDEFVDGNYIAGFEFQEILLSDLPQADTLKIAIEMHSISRSYYDFLLAIALETQYNGDLFSGPPANIPSNVSNGALGFFRASAVSSMYIEAY